MPHISINVKSIQLPGRVARPGSPNSAHAAENPFEPIVVFVVVVVVAGLKCKMYVCKGE